MTTTPTKKLKESNFGFIHLSSALAQYMNEEPKVVLEVYKNLYEKYFYQEWGIVESDSIQMNNEAVKNENGGDILAAYILSTGKKIWIKTVGYGLTEDKMDLKEYTKADYNNTCLMFPEDY